MRENEDSRSRSKIFCPEHKQDCFKLESQPRHNREKKSSQVVRVASLDSFDISGVLTFNLTPKGSNNLAKMFAFFKLGLII